MALTELFHADAEISVHPLLVSWYFISSVCRYLRSCMYIIPMIWYIVEPVIMLKSLQPLWCYIKTRKWKTVHQMEIETTSTLFQVCCKDTLGPYLFIMCLNYVLRTSIDIMKENGFKLSKEISRRSLEPIIMDAGYADIALLAKHTPKFNPCNIAWNEQQVV